MGLKRKILFVLAGVLFVAILFFQHKYVPRLFVFDYVVMILALGSACSFLRYPELRGNKTLHERIQVSVFVGVLFVVLLLFYCKYSFRIFPLDFAIVILVACLTYVVLLQQEILNKSILLESFFYVLNLFVLILYGDMSRQDMVRNIIFIGCSANVIVLTVSFLEGTFLGRLVNNLLLMGMLLIFGICCAYYYIMGSFYTCEVLVGIWQTNMSEVVEYLSVHCSMWMLLTCLVVLLICMIVGRYLMRLKPCKCRSKGLIFFVVSVFLINGWLTYRSRYNTLFAPYVGLKRFVLSTKEYREGIQRRKEVLSKLRFDKSIRDGVYVLVIGESHNKKHMSCYGYSRNTTPWLQSMRDSKEFLLFTNVYSCHTQTMYALPLFLTTKNQYNDIEFKDCPSLIEIVNAAGYNTVWLSNQYKYTRGDIPTATIALSAQQQGWCFEDNKPGYDESLLDYFDTIKLSDRMLIVVQLNGSHFEYSKRYPRSEICFQENNDVDCYDNSVYYNDKVMKSIYERCKKIPNFKALIYCSDHGEDVDHGYRHDISKFGLPMIEIPMYVLVSNKFLVEELTKYKMLRKVQDYYFTNDLMCNFILSIIGIRADKFYEPNNDILNEKYDRNVARFKTMHGDKNIRYMIVGGND